MRLTFKKENIASFEQLFENTKQDIRNFEGCSHLQLLRDRREPNVYVTYSHWESERHLENYRNSELFRTVWGETRALFGKPAVAWSLDPLASLN